MSINGGCMALVILAIRKLWLGKLPKRLFAYLWAIVIVRLLVPYALPSRASVSNLYMGRVGDVVGNGAAAAQGFGLSALTIIWLVGLAAAGIYFIITYLRTLRLIHRAQAVAEDDPILQALHTMDARRKTTVLRSAEIQSPVSFGILRRYIVFPLSGAYDGQTIALVLTHELIHLNRLDMLWKTLANIAVCIHWFNPLAWIMRTYFDRDLEIACDECVLHKMGQDTKKPYAMSLYLQAQPHRPSVFNHFGEKPIKERIKLLARGGSQTAWSQVGAIVLAVALVLITATTSTSIASTAEERLRSVVPNMIGRTKEEVDEILENRGIKQAIFEYSEEQATLNEGEKQP